MGRTQVRTGALFKRGGNRDYARHRSRLEILFEREFVPEPTGAKMMHLSRNMGIPAATLYRWRDKWRQNPDWRPWNTKKKEEHRIFTDAEEIGISDFIVKNYLVPGRLFTNSDFKQIAMDAWLEKNRDNDNIVPFEASDGFVTGFKKRNHFTTRRAHQKRRCPTSQEHVGVFIDTMRELMATKDHERIINADETFWRTVPGDLRTWGRRGSQGIQLHADGSEKEGITVLAAVSAARTKLPLQIIASGKTERCEQQLGDTAHHLKAHSKKGWSTGETFRLFLMSLRERFADDDPIWLVLDCSSAHRDPQTKTLARSLNINLIFIPAGFTDELQPLDRAIFGVLKSHLRRLWRERFTDNPEAKFTKRVAVELLIPAWERISPELIAKSWAIYEDQ